MYRILGKLYFTMSELEGSIMLLPWIILSHDKCDGKKEYGFALGWIFWTIYLDWMEGNIE